MSKQERMDCEKISELTLINKKHVKKINNQRITINALQNKHEKEVKKLKSKLKSQKKRSSDAYKDLKNKILTQEKQKAVIDNRICNNCRMFIKVKVFFHSMTPVDGFCKKKGYGNFKKVTKNLTCSDFINI